MADPPDIYAGAFERGPGAQLLIDAAGRLLAANDAARTLLGIAPADIGRAVRDLDVCVRLPQLASAAVAPAALPHSREIQWPSGLDVRVLRMAATPLPGGTRVDLTDVTEEAALRLDLQRTSRELADAYQQLGATTEQLRNANDRLVEAVEQLEATTLALRHARGSGV